MLAFIGPDMEIGKYVLMVGAAVVVAVLGALSVATVSLVVSGGLFLLGVLSKGTAGAVMVAMLTVGALAGLGMYLGGVLLE